MPKAADGYSGLLDLENKLVGVLHPRTPLSIFLLDPGDGYLMTARKFAVIAIVSGFVFSLAISVGAQLPPGGTFTDDDGNVHEGYIEAIAAKGITRGCNPPTNTRYCPGNIVTRGQMAAFIRRAFNIPGTNTDHFRDDNGSTFEADTNAIASRGITKGCNPPANTRFCPDHPVTRGEMAAFIRRALNIPNTTTDHFRDDNGSTFEADINAIASRGITKGCNPPANTRYCPNDLVKRDQMASFLARALHLNPIVPPPRTVPDGVRIQPGQSIQSAVDSHPGGTTFVLMAGTHQISTPIRPKSNQKFIGSGEVILTGSGTAQAAFEGWAASRVEVRGLVIERFNSAQGNHALAALTAGTGWAIVDNEVRHNTGMGVFHERDTVLRGNNIHHNRHSGVGGFKAHRSVIENNQIWENGAAQIPGQSAGGKWVGGIDLVVRGNHAYRNYGNGLWLDSDNVNALVEGNRVENTRGKGLHFEASCSGVLRNNVSRGNEAGLFLVASSNTVVSGNTFSGNDEAIRVAHLDRGTGENCRWLLNNVRIRNNTVTGGMVRVLEHSPVPDPGAVFQPGNTRVTFDHNTYKATTFTFNGNVSWNQWRNAGNDPNGSYSP